MKIFRRLIFVVPALLTAVFCTHPYEEGMTGSFPYFEVEDPTAFTYDAVSDGDMSGEVSFSTNMTVSATVGYSGGNVGWIMDVDAVAVKDGVVTLSFKVAENLTRMPRSAKITVLADGMPSGCVIDVRQNAYEITGKPLTYDGTLVLSTKSDVDDCIYTDITGDLVINGDEIDDLSSLSHVASVGGSLVVDDCARLSSLGPLGDLDVAQLVLSRAHAGQILSEFSGSFNALTIESPYDQPVDLSVVNDAGHPASLILKGVEVQDLHQVLSMAELEYLQVSESPISEPELRYIEAVRPDLAVESSDLSDDSYASVSLSDDLSATPRFTMNLYVHGYPSLEEVGYIVLPSGSAFDFEKRIGLDEWYYADSEFSVSGLSRGQEYVMRVYACGADGRIYLSEPLTFSI